MSAQPMYCRVPIAAVYYCLSGTNPPHDAGDIEYANSNNRGWSAGFPVSAYCKSTQSGSTPWGFVYYDAGSHSCLYMTTIEVQSDCTVVNSICWTSAWGGPSVGNECMDHC